MNLNRGLQTLLLGTTVFLCKYDKNFEHRLGIVSLAVCLHASLDTPDEKKKPQKKRLEDFPKTKRQSLEEASEEYQQSEGNDYFL